MGNTILNNDNHNYDKNQIVMIDITNDTNKVNTDTNGSDEDGNTTIDNNVDEGGDINNSNSKLEL